MPCCLIGTTAPNVDDGEDEHHDISRCQGDGGTPMVGKLTVSNIYNVMGRCHDRVATRISFQNSLTFP